MSRTLDVETWIRVPGMLCTSEIFHPLDSLMSATGRVIDMPLVGRSLDEASRALLERIHASPGQVGVIGLSLGGIVAMAAASREPDAFAALVLLSTNARSPSREQRGSWRALEDRVVAGDFRQLASDTSPPLWAPGADRERLALGRDQALAIGPEAFRDQLAIQQSRYDLRLGLTNLTAPTLVIAGTADQLCPVARHREISWFARAALREIAGAGHLSTIERPDLVAAALENWLSNPTPTHDRALDAAAS